MRRSAPVDAGFTLVEILVVLAILAALMGMVAAAVARAPAAKNRLVCMNNLRNLGTLILAGRTEGTVRTLPGPGFLLQLRAKGLVLRGDEAVFLCPDDPAFEGSGRPGFSALYDGIDPARPGAVPCSYLVRDFRASPLKPGSGRREPLAACPHHGDGAVVLYEDGTVRFLDREAIGVGPKDPVPFGPGAPAEDLRPFPAPAGR